MTIFTVNNYEELSQKAAEIIEVQVINKPDSVLGLATGSTPIRTYEIIAENNKAGKTDFSKVKTINLDEYCGLSSEHEQSYRYFMNKNLFDNINIDKSNTYVPSGDSDPEKASEDYEKLVESLGYADLQLLGIGNNGHIGFNEPCDYFPVSTHSVKLAESTIKANSRLFDRVEDVPHYAVTMGVGTILKAKKILLIASEGKEEIVERSVYGKVTPDVPASALQLHPDATVIYVKHNS